MSGPIITSHLLILRKHKISLILWKKVLPAGSDVGLRDVHEVWNPKHTRPIGWKIVSSRNLKQMEQFTKESELPHQNG